MIEQVSIQGYRCYRALTLRPNRRMNLLVGGNEAGKSTLLEAIALALTGRINGRWAREELNPHWFNIGIVSEFLQKRASGERVAWPEIRIELYLENRDDLQQLCGAVNSAVPTVLCPGVCLTVRPNEEYADELEEWLKRPSHLLPVEYFCVDWRSFADKELQNRPAQLVTAVIDSRTVRSSSGVDYHLREILSDQLLPAERAAMSLSYRENKALLADGALKNINDRLVTTHAALHDQPIAFAMDQTSRTSWEGAVVPHVADVPFSMAGQGQQAAIKISLAMSRQSARASFVLMEEPENHLSHTSLTVLLGRIAALAGEHQQLFVSTHSSFVINRLGIDSLQLLSAGRAVKLAALSENTVRYFQKLPGYDTLRLVLAHKVVLVEGPSDEIIFERVYRDLFHQTPAEAGVDVVSMRGLSLKRGLELCAALDKCVVAIGDNDEVDPAVLRGLVEAWLAPGKREAYFGTLEGGSTLEPQLFHANGEVKLRTILGIAGDADIIKWMKREKTEGALRLLASQEVVTPPSYMRDAAVFIRG